MAREAAWEFLMECLVVRQAMAVGTLRNITVLVLVAGYAGYGSVFAGAVRQFVEYLAVTGRAGIRRLSFAEEYLPRPVNRMALEAVRHGLSFDMGLVAGEAGRFEAVRSVAHRAGNLCVLARVCGKLVTDGAVAVEAIVRKLWRHGDLLWRVRIGMTCAAFGYLRSVRCFMAGRTLGHDCIIISLARAIGMQEVMAALAGETVPPAVILDALELGRVALGTLACRERLRLNGILLRGRRYRYRRDFFRLRLCKRHPRKCQCDHHSRQDSLECNTFRCSHFPSL